MPTLPDGAIRLEGVWKRFHADRRDTLLVYELSRVLKRMGAGADRWKWALRDVNLRIDPGEAVALVGHNGSGKTTLLKLMNRVMAPYAGDVRVGGRIGALIEVQAGIHPELSGRENIVLYGSLLGVPRRQMVERFDEIVAFAEIEDALDRQVKFYSWGMRMRLGFSVAAFLQPEVLLVDEVLAVGDSAFQQKCLSRMREVLEAGTTVVFVSHDLAAVEAICSRGVLLEHGDVKLDAPLHEALTAYRGDIERRWETQAEEGLVRLVAGRITGELDDPSDLDLVLEFGADALVEICLASTRARSGRIHVGVSEGPSMPIFLVQSEIEIDAGRSTLRCRLEQMPLPEGEYALWVGMSDEGGRDLLAWQAVTQFKVRGERLEPTPRGILRLSPVHVRSEWELSKP